MSLILGIFLHSGLAFFHLLVVFIENLDQVGLSDSMAWYAVQTHNLRRYFFMAVKEPFLKLFAIDIVYSSFDYLFQASLGHRQISFIALVWRTRVVNRLEQFCS